MRTNDGGAEIDTAHVKRALDRAMAEVRGEVGDERFGSGRFDEAAALFHDMVVAPRFVEFLTLPAYDRIVERGE